MNEFLEQFLIEARELVEQASADLLALEQTPADRARQDDAFRAFHTLKGSAGIIDFPAMARALHAAEDALDAVRSGAARVTPIFIGHALAAIDQVVRWLDTIEAEGAVPQDADPAAEAVIARFAGSLGDALPDAIVAGSPGDALPDAIVAGLPGDGLPDAIVQAQILMLQAAVAGEGLAGRIGSAARVAANVLGRVDPGAAARIAQAGQRAVAAGDPAPLIAELRGERLPEAAEPLAVIAPEATVRALRVEVERIDALVRLTGELTVVKNAMSHLAGGQSADAAALRGSWRTQTLRLERLVAELQHAVLGLRVLPLRQVFQRFPRVVRELGAKLDKSVRLVTEGDDTEADKAIVESLFEPLLHVLRNAVDHGLEPVAVRRARGKDGIGTITLRAGRSGEQVVVEVIDDGDGIDLGRVRAVAVERGVASAAAVAAMSEPEVIALLFAPGFSTSQALSEVSGRGVGMDAVRHAVGRLGGRVEITSLAGQGSTVRFVLPFTVMMTSVVTLEAGGQRFGLASESVVETLQASPAEIVAVGAARALVWRDRTIALLDLAGMVSGEGGRGGTGVAGGGRVVVARVGDEHVALQVAAVGERMDVMLKPMEGILAGTTGVSGTTLLGDGGVLIVLDVPALLE